MATKLHHGNDNLIDVFNREGVRFLVVGGYAVNFYVPGRSVVGSDLDLWIAPTLENADCILRAAAELLIPMPVSREALAKPKTAWSWKGSTHPCYAEFGTAESSASFQAEWDRANIAIFDGGHKARVASREFLIRTKHDRRHLLEDETVIKKDEADIKLLESESGE